MYAIIKMITDLNRCTMLYRSDRCASLGLNGQQATLLSRIWNHPGMSQEQIACMNFVDKSTAARQLARMEELGFIQRRPNEQDRRELLVYPSEKLEKCMPQIQDGIREWRNIVLGNMTEDEQEALFETLKQLLTRAKDAVSDLYEREGKQT